MMIRHTPTALVLWCMLGLAGAGVVAQSAGADAAEEIGSGAMFSLIDANGDGIIRADELRAHSDAWFSNTDENGDGQVTRDEMRSSAVVNNRFLREYDLDQDLQVTRREFLNGMRHDYEAATLDVPGGRLTTRAYAERVFSRDASLVPAAGREPAGEARRVSEDQVAADFERAFWRLDRDGDRALSRQEWVGHLENAPAFPALDADADQRVTRQEFMRYGQRRYASWTKGVGRAHLSAGAYEAATRWRDQALVPPPDANRDNLVSPAEAAADRQRLFSLYDRNADGVIAEEEWNPVWAVFVVRDDTALGREAFIAAREQELQDADLDRDGEVSVWEYRASRAY